MTTTFISRPRLFLGFLVLLSIFVTPIIAKAQPAAATDTRTVTINVDGSSDVIEALKTAATQAALMPVMGGGFIKIPIAVLKGVVVSKGWGWIGLLISKAQICQAFKSNCTGPGSFTMTLEIVIQNAGDPKPVIVIPMIAMPQGNGPGGSKRGIVAPIGPAGTPVMKLDVFGDGSLVIDAISCNMDSKRTN